MDKQQNRNILGHRPGRDNGASLIELVVAMAAAKIAGLGVFDISDSKGHGRS